MNLYRKYSGHIIFGLVSIVMLGLGGMKILGPEMIEQNFASLNLTLGVARVIGVIEVLAVIGLWVKPYRVVSSTVLALIYAGATGAHLGAGQGIEAAFPAITLAVLVLAGNLIEKGWERIASPFASSGALFELKKKEHHAHHKAA